MILNLDNMPRDSIKRLMWLSGVKEKATDELDQALAEAYYQARLERRLDTALALGLHSRKRVLAWTRRENERRGRTVRWADGADPSSSAYTG
jgi:hypothetical protein